MERSRIDRGHQNAKTIRGAWILIASSWDELSIPPPRETIGPMVAGATPLENVPEPDTSVMRPKNGRPAVRSSTSDSNMPRKIDQMRRVCGLQCHLANDLTWTHRLPQRFFA